MHSFSGSNCQFITLFDNHPIIFLVLLAVFIVFAIWLLPKIWRAIKAIFRKIGNLFGGTADEPASTTATIGLAGELEKLDRLRANGSLSDDEHQAAKQKILDS